MQTLKLYKILVKDLKKEEKLQKLFSKIELPISRILYKMERTGILVKPEVLKKLGVEVNRKLESIEKKILTTINAKQKSEKKRINLNSPKQVEILLFDELELPVIKKSKEGARSTDHEVLTRLSEVHPIPGMLLEYRELFKLKSTYIEPLPLLINPETERIHTTYGQTGVVTGRLSSSNPNLQNIPATKPFGVKIREAFTAGRGRRFMSADYSQIDLRVLAHFTSDKNLMEAFVKDKDIHTATAAEIFGVEPSNVKPEQRQVGKRINFSIIYGLTPYGLSRDLGIKPGEAKEYIDKYMAQYPSVAKWMDEVVEDAKKNGYVETHFGRRRYVPGLKEKNRTLFEQARRVTVNYPVQGTSAEIIKLAMINIDKAFTEGNIDAQMILQLHDELIIEFDMDLEKKVEKIIHECMENIIPWKVPLTVATRIGHNWADVTK